MDQWTKWVRVKTCAKKEYNTATKVVAVETSDDGYSYACVDSATARDLFIRHKFEVCAPPKAKVSEKKIVPPKAEEVSEPVEEKPKPKRKARTRKKKPATKE